MCFLRKLFQSTRLHIKGIQFQFNNDLFGPFSTTIVILLKIVVSQKILPHLTNSEHTEVKVK